MCLGLAARVVAPVAEHPDLAVVDIAGVQRTVNVGLLDEPAAPGDWLLVHMGFALNPIPAEDLADVLASLGLIAEEREAYSPMPDPGFEPEWAREP